MPWLHVFLFILGLILGHNTGEINTHITVAKECEKLGAFYVGNRVFECKKRE